MSQMQILLHVFYVYITRVFRLCAQRSDVAIRKHQILNVPQSRVCMLVVEPAYRGSYLSQVFFFAC